MAIIGAVVGLALIGFVFLEAFEVVVWPRRVMRPYRMTRLFYRQSWRLWRWVACGMRAGKRRETFLSVFGPLSMLSLFANWVVVLIAGFALLHWSLGTRLNVQTEEQVSFGTYLYLSGVTFFTLGYGEITAAGWLGRALTVAEAGLGFGFLAVMIGYLPVLYQAFSRREVTISLLDARAGSPPSATQALLRLTETGDISLIDPFLAEWERWAAELLESHLSFPVLSYYRSQHDNQSWLAALTAMLDTCAFLIAGVTDVCPYQAQLTFAMARHAAVDLALVFQTAPRPPDPDRLPPERLQQVREMLAEAGMTPRDGPGFEVKLKELRGMYEPFVNALGNHLLFNLPPVAPEKATVDNWQTSAWMRRVAGIGKLPQLGGDEHFN